MKKLFYSLLALVLMFSCSKDNTEMIAEADVLTFSVSEVVTRASSSVSYTTTLTAGTNMLIYKAEGGKVTSGIYTISNVSSVGGATLTYYSGTEFTDVNGSLTTYCAIYPYSADMITPVSINLDASHLSADVLYAEAKVTSTGVSFQFNHLFACLTYKFTNYGTDSSSTFSTGAGKIYGVDTAITNLGSKEVSYDGAITKDNYSEGIDVIFFEEGDVVSETLQATVFVFCDPDKEVKPSLVIDLADGKTVQIDTPENTYIEQAHMLTITTDLSSTN